MRVTETRMIEMVTLGVSRSREQAAKAGEAVQSGMRVRKPSDDPAAWEQGMRAQTRAAMSDRRGDAIGRANARLAETDGALDGVGSVLSRVTELATQLASDTYNATDRANAATEIRALREAALNYANTRGTDGEYLLAGAHGDVAPFDTTGAYVGDATTRQIEVSEGQRMTVSVAGSSLTAAEGVDVFGVLDAIAGALEANDMTALRTGMTDLKTAVGQVSDTRADVGARMRALAAADEARVSFEQGLAETRSRAVEQDPIAGASELARAATALESARTVAEQIIAMFRR